MSKPLLDMHCHTTNSDGTQSPEEVYRYAREKGIDIFAITDHDRITTHPDFPAGVQKDGRLILEGVEVSGRYEHGDYRKSVHIPAYALSLKGELQDILTGIRRGKAEKVQRQCEQLKSNGCMIELPDSRIVPFSFDAMRACFPETQEDGFNNAHLTELVLKYRKNLRKLQDIAPGITEHNLLRDGFKSEGKYRKEISLREKLPEYEPRIEELIEAVDRNNTIVSLAHPNYTFATIAEFRQHIGRITALGVNAIEINSTATREWTDEIELIRDWQVESYSPPSLLTFGSDCHDLYPTRVDNRHSLLGDMNPYITARQKQQAALQILDFFSPQPELL